MRSSKKYQQIADILKEAKDARVDAGTYSTGNSIMLDMIVSVACEVFKKDNPKFKEDFFRKQVYR